MKTPKQRVIERYPDAWSYPAIDGDNECWGWLVADIHAEAGTRRVLGCGKTPREAWKCAADNLKT